MKIVFFGTPIFAEQALKTLNEKKIGEIVLVVTQPDRPVGRKKNLKSSLVKVYAQEHGLRIIQPEKLDADVVLEILKLKPELGVVVSYGKIIPKELIDGFPRGIVNIHPSLLPRHRGAVPIASVILDGDTETGVSLMLIDEKVDHGPLIAQRKIELQGDETSDGLLKRLTPIALQMLEDELILYLNGAINPIPQQDSLASFRKAFKEEDAKIDWQNSAEKIERLVRAMHGHIPAWSMLDKNKMLVHRARAIHEPTKFPPGTIVKLDDQLAVCCGQGSLIIDELQLSGGKPMSGQAFLNGHGNLVGAIAG